MNRTSILLAWSVGLVAAIIFFGFIVWLFTPAEQKVDSENQITKDYNSLPRSNTLESQSGEKSNTSFGSITTSARNYIDSLFSGYGYADRSGAPEEVQYTNDETQSSVAKSTYVSTQGGTRLLVKDFTSDIDVKKVVSADKKITHFILKDAYDVNKPKTVPGSGKRLYIITYYPTDSSFGITVTSEPVPELLQEAARELQKRLGITETEMCLLFVNVGVPYWVRESLSGFNLGLPNCPGSYSF